MSPFEAYLLLGWEHILDPGGYDHLLFLLALLASHEAAAWRRVVLLVTAFTVGHSLTLAWTALHGPLLPSPLVEFLIPVTILVTALGNLTQLGRSESSDPWGKQYALTTLFGLIHGMGFSGFFRSLLGPGSNVLLPLVSFNIGIELGQICFVALVMTMKLILSRWAPQRTKIPAIALNVFTAAMAIFLMIQKFPL